MQGRDDDNVDTIRRRLEVFQESTLPVIQHYEKSGKLRRVIENMEYNMQHMEIIVPTPYTLKIFDNVDTIMEMLFLFKLRVFLMRIVNCCCLCPAPSG
jgi:adenylate kinase family enzyme